MERHAPYYAAPPPGQHHPPQQPQHYTQQPPQQAGSAPLYVQPPPGLAALPNYPPPDRLPNQQPQPEQQQPQLFPQPLGVAYGAPGLPVSAPGLAPWATHQPFVQVQQLLGALPGPGATGQAPWVLQQQQTQQPLLHQQQQQLGAAGLAPDRPGLQASQPAAQHLGQGQGQQAVPGGQAISAPLDSAAAGGPGDPRPRPARSHYSSKPLSKEQLERQQQKVQQQQEQQQQQQQAGNGVMPPLGAGTQQAQQAAPVPRYISNMPPPVSAPGATSGMPGGLPGAGGEAAADGVDYLAGPAPAALNTLGQRGHITGSAATMAPQPIPTAPLAQAHAGGTGVATFTGLTQGGYPPSSGAYTSSAAPAMGQQPAPPVPGRTGSLPSGSGGGGGGVGQMWTNGLVEAPAPARSDRAPLILSDRALAPTAGAKRAFDSLGFPSEGLYRDHKRQQNVSSTAAGSSHPGGPQQQQQMRRVSDTVFRLVLNLNDTALLIGKGGGTIRQIERDTGARVKRLPEPPGGSEQVIVIWSPPSAGVEGERFNSAQRALLDCCSRVLLAQNPPSVAGMQGRLHMLINRTQELAVVGRGGATISRVRAESNASVRVFLPHQLPPCALDNDLMVEVVGDAAAVLKAVELLGALLRESPPTEKPGDAPMSLWTLLYNQPGMAPVAAGGLGAAGGLPPGFGGPGSSLGGQPHGGGGGGGGVAGGGGMGGASFARGGGGAPAYPPGFGPPGTNEPRPSGTGMRPMQPLPPQQPPQQPPPMFNAGRGPPPPQRPPPPGPPGAGFGPGFAPPMGPMGRAPMQPPPPRPMGPARPPGYGGIPPGGYY
ncbi:hypothetical protein N2152v2_006713 [Parachlorella kessleri]